MPSSEWKRSEYKTWDEAFRGLAPAVRQQSIRVAAYTRALFVRACSLRFGGDDPASAARMRGQYADVAYKCGMYCQLGKALVPPEYQILQRDFTAEELAVYRKYTGDGYGLVVSLQMRMMSARERRRGKASGYATENIPWLMVRESALQHMERWDGTGYPEGRSGEAISPIAQITGLALELDRLSAERKSETPFDEALTELYAGEGTAWNPALLEVLKKAEKDCREIYERYIHYTMTLPETIPLVGRRPERPFGLQYRPMVAAPEGKYVAFEAIPWFAVSAEGDGEKLPITEYEELLERTGLLSEVVFYLLYEAADLLYRLKNCQLMTLGVILEMPTSVYKEAVKLQEFEKLFEDQPVDREKLLLTIPEAFVAKANKGTSEMLARYQRNGVHLLLDGWHPGVIPSERLKELGFRSLRLAPELLVKEETAAAVQLARGEGFRFFGGNADTEDTLLWQLREGVLCAGGTMSGVPEDEDAVIRTALLKERE